MNELEIFSVAIEIDDHDLREKYLQQTCSYDDALRLRLDELLQSAAKQDGFLDTAPHVVQLRREVAETQDAAVEHTQLGVNVGPFKLLENLGEGGMGTVFLAEQKHPVRRRVAVKIVKLGMDSKSIVNRFEAERQALSMMDHPNIARALDAGTTDAGQPYFVMEWVKGNPITRYCDKHRLSTRERLELLVPVCHAVQHAHQKGIVHRDIKPSNILVAEYDGRAVPKVIDFGIAKALYRPLTEDTLFTQIGQIVGTLEYMSPEQAKVNELDVDTRSDIYSLGVVMYELLTGTTPHAKGRLCNASLDELIRIIRDEEPTTPSKRLASCETLAEIATRHQTTPARLTATVHGEMDWIVMKALDKERNRRYQSCGELADDIRRFLDDEQVRACPPTARYRFRKFVHRNAGAVTAVSAAVVTMAIGYGSAVWQAEQKRQDYDQLMDGKVAFPNSVAAARNMSPNQERDSYFFEKHLQQQRTLQRAFEQISTALHAAPMMQRDTNVAFRNNLLSAILEYWDEMIEGSVSRIGNDAIETREHRIQRALTLARMGDHTVAFDELAAVVNMAADKSRPIQMDYPRKWTSDLVRICGICAAGADDQSRVDRYIDAGLVFLRHAVMEARLDVERIDREKAIGIQTAERDSRIVTLQRLLSNPDLIPLRSRSDEYANFQAIANSMSNDRKIQPTEIGERSLSGK